VAGASEKQALGLILACYSEALVCNTTTTKNDI